MGMQGGLQLACQGETVALGCGLLLMRAAAG